MNGKAACVLAAMVASGGLSLFSVAQEPASVDRWWDRVQFYTMVPLPMEQAQSFHATVNGVWAGFFNSSPVVSEERHSPTLNAKYQNDEPGYVRDMHAAGLKTVGIVPGIAGHPKILERWPYLREAAARGADGKPLVFSEEDKSLFMCGNNPLWLDWQLEQLKHSVDLGVDLLTIDEIQGNCLLQWGGVCCCDYCRTGFQAYLQERFTPQQIEELFGLHSLRDLDLSGLTLLDNFDNLLAGELGYTYEQRIAERPLVGEYWRFQEQANYRTKKQLCELIRAYTHSKGKYIPITANTAGLTALSVEGFWFKSLPYMAFVDFAVYENTTQTLFGPNKPFPEGSWIGKHKLGHAVNGSRNAAIPDIPTVGALYDGMADGKTSANYLYILMTEAYANGGASVFYAFESYLPELWTKCGTLADFISKHKDLYDSPATPATPLAILYLYGEGMRNKVGAYYGLARALAESNIPYEVVFAGDGYYLPDKLKATDLEPYKTLIVPSMVEVTNDQRAVVDQYLQKGGTVIYYDAGKLPESGGTGKGVLMPKVTTDRGECDLATAYHETNDRRYREQLAEFVRHEAGELMSVQADGDNVVVYPAWQEKDRRLVLHVVNYDHDRDTDAVHEKQNVVIRVKAPGRLRGRLAADVLSPDEGIATDAAVTNKGGFIELTLPRLAVYEVVVVRPAGSRPDK